MWRQATMFLRRQRTRAILASGGFSLAACMLILLTATTQSVVLRANQIISQNWRPTYDIVVLPPQAPAVRAGQAVPADLVEGYGGGISIQQYQQIERLSGVAVAAPIAFIGYTPFENINVFSGPQSPTPGFYDAHWELVASNGVQQIVEEQGGDRIYVFPNCPGNVFYHAGDATDRAFQQLQVTTEQCSQNTQLSEQIPHLDQASPVQAGLGVFLVAAIDPTAENALIHLGANVTSGSMLNETQGAQPDSITPTLSMGDGSPSYANLDIPLLLNMQPRGQVRLQATIVRRQTQSADLQQTITQGGATYIEHAPTQTLFQGAVPLPWNDPQLLTQLGFDCEGHTCTEPTEQITPIALNFSGAPSGLTYVRTAHTPAGYSGPAYALVPASDQTVANPGNVAGGQEIAFRSLSPLPAEDMFGSTPIYNGAAFNGVVAGVFDSQRLSATFADTLNWLPEATYAASPTTLRYDAQGRPIAPTMLLPTTNPAGLVLQPPLALTTLAAAQRIEGNRLISVIRVRVSGQVTPDDTGWERVARVAQAIHDATGLRALVTLGSSPTPTLVYVPGTASAPPTGWVQER